MAGWRCPQCSSTDLSVNVTISARLNQESDGNFQTEVEGDHEWDATHSMCCNGCHYRDPAASFEV